MKPVAARKPQGGNHTKSLPMYFYLTGHNVGSRAIVVTPRTTTAPFSCCKFFHATGHCGVDDSRGCKVGPTCSAWVILHAVAALLRLFGVGGCLVTAGFSCFVFCRAVSDGSFPSLFFFHDQRRSHSEDSQFALARKQSPQSNCLVTRALFPIKQPSR